LTLRNTSPSAKSSHLPGNWDPRCMSGARMASGAPALLPTPPPRSDNAPSAQSSRPGGWLSDQNPRTSWRRERPFGDAPMLEIRRLPAVHRTVTVLRCHRSTGLESRDELIQTPGAISSHAEVPESEVPSIPFLIPESQPSTGWGVRRRAGVTVLPKCRPMSGGSKRRNQCGRPSSPQHSGCRRLAKTRRIRAHPQPSNAWR
jgi:hypothetical protein